jgi:hypothetical protein
MFHAIFLAYMPTGEALKPERDPPGVLTGRTGKKEAPWVGLPRLPSFQQVVIRDPSAKFLCMTQQYVNQCKTETERQSLCDYSHLTTDVQSH